MTSENSDIGGAHIAAAGTLAPSRRRAILSVFLLFTYLLIEGIAFVGLKVLDAKGYQGYAPTLTSSVSEEHREILTRVTNGEAKYIGFDKTLGWTTLPNGRNDLYEANSQGVRGSREYADVTPDGALRIAAFGDSYIHGDDEKNEDAWSIIMERRDQHVEVMNFGVGGYGPDQAYLRYLQEGSEYSPQVVLIGYQSENINRVVNVFRPFYSPTTGNPLAKPYFKLLEGKLNLQENPIGDLSGYRNLLRNAGSVLPEMGKNDFHYQFRYKPGLLDWSPTIRLSKLLFFEYRSRFMNPLYSDGVYEKSSEAYALVVAIIREFYCSALANGSLPIVVQFPNRGDLAAFSNGEPVTYLPLKKHLVENGYLSVDLVDAFSDSLKSANVRDLIKAHYTPLGNASVANYLLEEIRELRLAEEDVRAQLVERQVDLQCSN